MSHRHLEISNDTPVSVPMHLALRALYGAVVLAVTMSAFIFGLSWKADNALAAAISAQSQIDKIQEDRSAKFAAISNQLGALQADTRSMKDSLDRINRKLDK